MLYVHYTRICMKLKNKKIILIIILAVIIWIALAVLGGIIIINNVFKGDNKTENNKVSNNNLLNNKQEVKIVESKNKTIKYTEYNNGLFSVKLPEGWKVDTIGDNIHYTIKVYDPQNSSYQFFFNMKTEGYNKSQAAKNFQQKYYPDQIFAKNPVIEEKTTEGFYKIFNEMGQINNNATFKFPTLTDFKTISNIGTSPIGGDILRAEFKDEKGNNAQGIFTAYVYDAGPYYVYEDVFSGNKIDIYYLSVYNTLFITAPSDEFINWEEPLNTIASSLEFTDTFINGFYNQQDSVMKNFQNVRSICNQMSDTIMSSWENRNKSFDIMSQKQSDSILGYERVYDTQTGDVYKAYNGFTDDYYGDRYKSISDDMYTKSIDGYIEKW